MKGNHRLPDRGSLLWPLGAAAVWAGVAVGVKLRPAAWPVVVILAGACGVFLVLKNKPALHKSALLLGLAAAGTVSGIMLFDREQRVREAELPAGPVQVTVRAVTAGRGSSETDENGYVLVKPTAVVRSGGDHTRDAWDGPPGWLRGEVSGWRAGQLWEVRTIMRPDPGGGVGRPVAWSGAAKTPRLLGTAGGWPGGAVAAFRNYLLDRLEPHSERGRALLAGFLLGDTSHLASRDVENMRRSGMSHYVAVSGSNVALFLGALFLAAGPLGWSSRRRAVLGLAGLVFFVLLIGPDPSVLRAAVMAGLILVAVPFGLLPDIWKVMGTGVGLLLLISPELGFSLGFMLSVAATAGVVIGSGWFPAVKPRWLGTSLGASCGAQAAVAPVLLLAVGGLPLWSPLANVLSAPLVAAATIVGGLGALTGFGPLLWAGSFFGKAVLGVAGVTALLPQVGWLAFALLATAGAGLFLRRTRPPAAIAGALLVLIFTLPAAGRTSGPVFAALDVGQGDSLLLLGAGGEVILVDGGSDGRMVLDGLSRHGVRSIDLLVVSHSHFDHYGGLGEVLAAHPVGTMWYAPFPGQGEGFARFAEAAARRTRVAVPELGGYRVGGIDLEVIGPRRRYASRNDQSLVMVASYAGTRILLSGDIETIAQRETPPPPVDILKVPHQGADTSDPDWLKETAARLAVVSVGPNTYGHPSETLLSDLAEAGMTIRRTDQEGDVVVPLPLPGVPPAG